MTKTATKTMKIAFQGEPGANSHIAITEAYPDAEALACPTFEDALAAIASGEADLGMIPIENSVAGRVADIHHLLPQSGLFIVGEWFLPVHHQLMAPRGAKLADIKTVESHVHALGQCRRIIRKLGIKPIVSGDTAGSARIVAERGDKTCASIASKLASEIYGLDILAEDVEDETHNTTRFVVLAREANWAKQGSGPLVTSFVSGAQPSRRTLQGDGGVCHQRRQHHQAGKLHGRRQFLRHRILRRRRWPSRGPESRLRARRAEILLARTPDCRGLSGPSVPGDVQRDSRTESPHLSAAGISRTAPRAALVVSAA